MAKATYYGIIHKDGKSDFGVSFPDFPGCISAHTDFDEAVKEAGAALSLHIQGMLEDGETIPASSKSSDVLDLAQKGKAKAVVSVNVDVPHVRVKRYNITARDSDMGRIDRFLKAQKRTRDRSEFIMQAALKEISRQKSV